MIQDRLISLDEIQHLITTEPPQRADPHTSDLQPGLNSMMRCPLPPVNVTPDTTRQFYRGGMLPQIRVMSPPVATGNSNSGGTSTVGVTSSSSSSSTTLTVQQTAVTTQVLNPNQIFNSSLAIGKVIDFIQISSSLPARVRLYGSQAALNLDTARALDVAPSFGIEQGLILDAVLDTAPYTMPVEGISGSNYEQPQKNLIYIAVTNVGNSSSAIVVTISYVALVS